MPMTRRKGITNRSKAKSQNARKRGPTPGFPAKSNTLSRQLLPISQADPHSSRTTTLVGIAGEDDLDAPDLPNGSDDAISRVMPDRDGPDRSGRTSALATTPSKLLR